MTKIVNSVRAHIKTCVNLPHLSVCFAMTGHSMTGHYMNLGKTVQTINNWMNSYTTQELQSFQRQDPDLAILHDWLDEGIKPSRDAVTGYNPDIRHLWIEFDRLKRPEGILHLNWVPTDTGLSRLLFLAPQCI